MTTTRHNTTRCVRFTEELLNDRDAATLGRQAGPFEHLDALEMPSWLLGFAVYHGMKMRRGGTLEYNLESQAFVFTQEL